MSDAGESTTDRREKSAEHIGSLARADSKNEVIEAIDKLLGVSPPVGSPSTIDAVAKRYKDQADDAADVQDRVEKVAKSGLPSVWVGSTGAKASEVVSAAGRSAEQMAEAFRKASRALNDLSDALTSARSTDDYGREQLRKARGMLGEEDGFFDDMVEKDAEEAERKRAQDTAGAGANCLHSAAKQADDAARTAARELNKYASEARAGQMKTDEISAADRLVLADIAVPGGPQEQNELLSANDLERSGRYMEKMSDADQAKCERMLADAKTPQERAYLVKALASGNSLGEIGEFRDKIHGKDPAWLQQHLSPVTTAADSKKDEGLNPDGSNRNTDYQWFGDEKWSQDGNTCVPSSTVTARAMVDPVYALELTGGPSGQENDPDAFRERLGNEQMRLHEEGDGDYEHWWSDTPSGMDSDGQNEIANKEISPHTGSGYDHQEVRSADARRDVLPDVEKAVADGKPVPFEVEGYDKDGRHGHQMMIIGQEGDKLQIYNPWGQTTWVSEDDFVNGHMDKASDSRMPDAYSVHVPAD
ncbi:WXG100 family type VII secretion target [Streptomyces sp. HNM0575]|uniref:WXG100 family type VII secretion target n=1 Tax=Streptomyces sp. HNM0575 TaxID=2716338 RepID=UPI00145DBE13|nr:WXG100 family type VII secretion target [Streptomyces sp. HNM0575]NLU71567.1 WXG100 family type VII secretion target [Streptomyces sp. HNM0575]